MSDTASVTLQGEELLLHPERAVIWPRARAVIVADTHFAKSSVFNRHGVPVPGGTDQLDRERLARLLESTASVRLIVLGDFLHAPLEPGSPEARDLESWIGSLRGTRVQVIAGNHDRGVSQGWRGPIEWTEGPHFEAPFHFVHEQKPARSAFALSGHVHPVIQLRGLRKRPARIPVFWLRANGLVLPSFGLFTGGYVVRPDRGEQVYAVSPERVVPFPMKSA